LRLMVKKLAELDMNQKISERIKFLLD